MPRYHITAWFGRSWNLLLRNVASAHPPPGLLCEGCSVTPSPLPYQLGLQQAKGSSCAFSSVMVARRLAATPLPPRHPSPGVAAVGTGPSGPRGCCGWDAPRLLPWCTPACVPPVSVLLSCYPTRTDPPTFTCLSAQISGVFVEQGILFELVVQLVTLMGETKDCPCSQ